MRTTPKTEKELQEANLLPKGWYPFHIQTAEDKLSKAAKERGETEPNMIELNVQVFRDQGFVFVKDWLMDTEFGAHKLRHCADACRVLDRYESGSLEAEDLESKEGYVKIGIQKSEDEQWPDKNKILDYAKDMPVKKGEAAVGKPNKPNIEEPGEDEDEIPFK